MNALPLAQRIDLHRAHAATVDYLIHDWARAIDEDRVEAIAELLHPAGRYRVASRFNVDRGLPHALIDCASPAQLRDRILSMRVANVYEPQHYRHLVSGVQIVGGEPAALEVRSNFMVVRTLALDGEQTLFCSGQARDVVDITGAAPCFRARHLVLDSRAVETLLVIPL